MLFVLKTKDLTEIALLTLIVILYFYINHKNKKIEGYNLNAEIFAPIGCNGLDCDHDHSVQYNNKDDDNIVDDVVDAISDTFDDLTDDNENDHNKAPPKSIAYDSKDKMSKFDGLCLKTGNVDSWMKSPSNIALNGNDGLYTIQGGTAPVKPVFSDPSSLHGPPIDGVESSPHKLFMFANNQVSPDCCPSTFSTSTGCICSTHQQREYIKHRGKNVTGCNLTI